MKNFVMCDKCYSEYNDPQNRRYHAQPISCYECGPSLKIVDINSDIVTQPQDAIKQISTHIKNGKIVAIKGLGGFHIVCDASNSPSVQNLRTKKRRPTKPLAVMFKDINSIKQECLLNKNDESLICSESKTKDIFSSSSSISRFI
jgi:hydrogenase maturation protein HypF